MYVVTPVTSRERAGTRIAQFCLIPTRKVQQEAIMNDLDACCAIGGIPVRDPAWGGFEACVPQEIDPNVSWIDMCP